MKTFYQIIIIFFVSIHLVACGLKLGDSDAEAAKHFSEEGSDSAISAGLASLAGVMQMGNEEGGAISSFDEDFYFENNNPHAFNTCGKPATTQPCIGGVKNINYSECLLAGGIKYTGSVTLIYSESASCTLNSGSSVTRRVSIDRSGFLDSIIRTSTLSHTDYRGNILGSPIEGARLLKNATGFSLDIYGTRKIRTTNTGTVLYDVSIRSTLPLTVTGGLSGTRTIEGGTIEVIHNTNKYVATITPSNLVYSSTTCCHPTSGSIIVNYSGTIGGKAEVIFGEQCGVVDFVRDGLKALLRLHGCE